MVKFKQILSSLLFYLAILFFIIGFQFSDNRAGGWTQQFMPNLGGQSIQDITFLDSLNGYAVTGLHYILKTTNGGDNWTIIYNDTTGDIFKRIKFLNQNIGFVCGGITENSIYYMLKTTNGGINWFNINAPFQSVPQDDISILNEDTMWVVFSESLTGGVYRTTNGGASWDRQLNLGSQNPNHIYMYNGRIGFICEDNVYLRRTTNSGLNWDTVSGAGGFLDMYFVDSLTGWKTSMQKTTDGGLNWINQTLPQGGNIIVSTIIKFSNVNRDTIWGVGGYVNTSLGGRGMVYRTINGGNNWLFQVPDTNINIFRYFHNKFVSRLNGWAYSPISGVHTTSGGDPIFYTSIKQVSSKTPDGFKLEQNYPNPFNPVTSFKFRVSSLSNIQIKIYDINGRLMTILVNKQIEEGEYLISFDGSNYSSGIYFYSLIVDGKPVDTKKMILLK